MQAFDFFILLAVITANQMYHNYRVSKLQEQIDVLLILVDDFIAEYDERHDCRGCRQRAELNEAD